MRRDRCPNQQAPPASGEVEYLNYRPGKFLDARDPNTSRENESQSIGMRLDETDCAGLEDRRLLIRQISGAIARRIICPLEIGDHLERAGLMGMIKYGSRTELVVPSPKDENAGKKRWVAGVQPGDRVKGGVTVMFRLTGN